MFPLDALMLYRSRKRIFYRGTNVIFVKVGRLASEEVILKLIV